MLVVDDHPMLREGVAAVVARQSDMTLVGEATNGVEAIERFRELRPDVTLMDLQMPLVGGVDAIRAIRREFPSARIIVLTTYAGDVQALTALKAGAVGYLLKSTLRKEMLDAIRIVHAGRRYLPPEIATEIAMHAVDDALTEREAAVLRYVALGKTNKEIARQIAISDDTVKGHLKSIFAKLGVGDRTQAVIVAAKRGIIDI
ncbi:MAG TPA: response regulator transcription factor [Tahibacter sp.]|nr:response regulator transcription factor [Tahibacter sp.]